MNNKCSIFVWYSFGVTTFEYSHRNGYKQLALLILNVANIDALFIFILNVFTSQSTGNSYGYLLYQCFFRKFNSIFRYRNDKTACCI